MDELGRIYSRLDPLDQWLKEAAGRPRHVTQVAGRFNVSITAALIDATGWADVSRGSRLIHVGRFSDDRRYSGFASFP